MKPFTVTYKDAFDAGCPMFTCTAYGTNATEAEDWFWCSCDDEGDFG